MAQAASIGLIWLYETLASRGSGQSTESPLGDVRDFGNRCEWVSLRNTATHTPQLLRAENQLINGNDDERIHPADAQRRG